MTNSNENQIIRFDWAMKRLLRNKANFSVLEGLLTTLLGEKIIIRRLLESESNQEDEYDKYNRVDMLAENSKGELVLIEVQNNNEYAYFQRMLFGTSKLVTEYINRGESYDKVILATGAWLGQMLEPLGYQVDVRPQKGQLRDYQLDRDIADYPVVMPEGELDIIPFQKGKISMGATHENEMGFDLTVDQALLNQMETEALAYYPELAQAEVIGERVGTRAYTSDFSPFWGAVPDQAGLYVASGLGSSGLTTGPLIGWHLAQLVVGGNLRLDPADYPVEQYVKK